jgi:hypothetical protein
MGHHGGCGSGAGMGAAAPPSFRMSPTMAMMTPQRQNMMRQARAAAAAATDMYSNAVEFGFDNSAGYAHEMLGDDVRATSPRVEDSFLINAAANALEAEATGNQSSASSVCDDNEQ